MMFGMPKNRVDKRASARAEAIRSPDVKPRRQTMTGGMFTFSPIGFAHTPFAETSAIPKGCGAKHEADGTLEILPEFEAGLADIEGFSHLFVLWIFDRAKGAS